MLKSICFLLMVAVATQAAVGQSSTNGSALCDSTGPRISCGGKCNTLSLLYPNQLAICTFLCDALRCTHRRVPRKDSRRVLLVLLKVNNAASQHPAAWKIATAITVNQQFKVFLWFLVLCCHKLLIAVVTACRF